MLRRTDRYVRFLTHFPATFFTLSFILCSIVHAEGLNFQQSIDVVARIEPELGLQINPDTGKEIDFGTLYSSPFEERVSAPINVKVNIFSNIGTPYEVSQQLVYNLHNEADQQLPKHALQVSSLSSNSAPDYWANASEPTTIFNSDARGHSDEAQVAYRLQVPAGQEQGLYRGTILMTVTAR